MFDGKSILDGETDGFGLVEFVVKIGEENFKLSEYGGGMWIHLVKLVSSKKSSKGTRREAQPMAEQNHVTLDITTTSFEDAICYTTR